MIKKLVLTTFLGLVLWNTSLLAQDKRTTVFGVEMRTNALEIGAEYLSPMKDMKELFGEFSYGIAARYRFGITEHKSLLFSLGYEQFKGGKVQGYTPNTSYTTSLGLIPVKFGLHFKVIKTLYIAGETGVSISTGVPNYDKYGGTNINDYKFSTVMFNFSPSIGFQLPLANKNYIDLSARYEGIADQGLRSFAGFRAAYALNISR